MLSDGAIDNRSTEGIEKEISQRSGEAGCIHSKDEESANLSVSKGQPEPNNDQNDRSKCHPHIKVKVTSPAFRVTLSQISNGQNPLLLNDTRP